MATRKVPPQARAGRPVTDDAGKAGAFGQHSANAARAADAWRQCVASGLSAAGGSGVCSPLTAALALYHHLTTRDQGAPRSWAEPPVPRAWQDRGELGRESVEPFLDEWQSGELGLPFCPCRPSQLYQAYLGWCWEVGVHHPSSKKQFANHIRKLRGWERTHKDTYDDLSCAPPAKRTRVIIPSAEAMGRAAANGRLSDMNKPADQTQAQWITRCVLGFEFALGARLSGAEGVK